MNKNYNFERKKMNLPEYGRNIMKMVEYLQSIEDRELRNQQARVVIEVMGNINTHLRDTDDLKHKLWDHLFIISDFQLDVDSPYPIPDPTSIVPKPDRLSYPTYKIHHRHYGKHIEDMIGVLCEDQSEECREIVVNIAKYMRNKSHEYNQEHPSNEIVINDLRIISNHRLVVEDDLLDSSRSEYKPQTLLSRLKNNKPQKNNKTPYSRQGNNGKKNSYRAKNY